MRIYLAHERIVAALQVFRFQTLYLHLFLPLLYVQFDEMSQHRTEEAGDEVLEHKHAPRVLACSVGLEQEIDGKIHCIHPGYHQQVGRKSSVQRQGGMVQVVPDKHEEHAPKE